MKNISFLILICSLMFLGSCREDTDIINIIDDPIDDPVILVQTSVTGSVQYPNGDPVVKTEVNLGEHTVLTNDFGRFSFYNIEILSHKQTLKIQKEGYFNASRNFKPLAGQKVELRIQLLERQSLGSYHSTNAREFTGTGNFKIDFPANAIADQSGQPYNGNVHVFANWMDPSSEDIYLEMPGDLVGLDREGNSTGLVTYGMLNVELETDAGEPLNLATGVNAHLSFPVPDELLVQAPLDIPLWYFDDEQQVWIEDGMASLVGKNYVGSVSHFTPWNCDDPVDVVTITGTIELTNLQDNHVKIKLTSQTTDFEFFAYSNANGAYSINAVQNEVHLMEIFDECDEVIFSVNIGPYANDHHLETINSESTTDDSYVKISGVAKDCNGSVLVNAEAGLISNQGVLYSALTDESGNFELHFFSCENKEYSVQILDCENHKVYNTDFFQAADDVSLGELVVCEDIVNFNHFAIYFDNRSWEEMLLMGMSYEIEVFQQDPLKINVKLIIINWLSSSLMEINIPYENGEVLNPVTANFNGVTFDAFGFRAVGDADVDFQYENGGLSNLNLNFVSSEIVVTDPLLFPGNINQVRIKVVNN